MSSVESGYPASYIPRRFDSGTFPVPRNYNLRQMLYNYSRPGGMPRVHSTAESSDPVIPSFPFSDVPVYADTVDIETLAFHDFWGCILTPDNVVARMCTDDLRYHIWVASKRVIESGRIDLTEKEALVQEVMDQFLIELGLVLLDLFPGPLVLFVDPRLHDDSSQMISRAVAMVAKFDAAQVRRWRIMITLPATEAGICAAHELTQRYGVQTNLSLVSCLEHAAACIEAGARMVSMSVEPIMEWFEQQCGNRSEHVSQDHPGIEVIQSCATYIRHHRLNTTVLTTDVREWAELKHLDGVGATALTKTQLDEIPMQRLVTWYPKHDDNSSTTLRALQEEYPSHYLDSKRGLMASLPARCRSLVNAVLYVRLGRMASHMETIEKAVRYEIKRRIRLETIPLEKLYRRPSSSTDAHPSRKSTSSKSTTTSSKRSRSRSRTRRSSELEIPDSTMVEDVDYF